MKRSGDLPFDFIDGSCNSFDAIDRGSYMYDDYSSDLDPQVYLCFSSAELTGEISLTDAPMEFRCYHKSIHYV